MTEEKKYYIFGTILHQDGTKAIELLGDTITTEEASDRISDIMDRTFPPENMFVIEGFKTIELLDAVIVREILASKVSEWNRRHNNLEGNEMEEELNSRIREIVEKMEEEGRPMINLSRLFIMKPLSLEVLLILEDKGSVTIEQISKMTGNAKLIEVLEELKGFGVIDDKNDIVNLTDRGQWIVMKLRIKMNSFGKDDEKLCNMRHD